MVTLRLEKIYRKYMIQVVRDNFIENRQIKIILY